LLGAITPGGGRSTVIDGVRKAKVQEGIIGTFSFLPSGDPSIGPITVSIAKKTFVPVGEVYPKPAMVKAARSG
jgi:ABC-type branched-subunit amino acid transport system substrate-binding protein